MPSVRTKRSLFKLVTCWVLGRVAVDAFVSLHTTKTTTTTTWMVSTRDIPQSVYCDTRTTTGGAIQPTTTKTTTPNHKVACKSPYQILYPDLFPSSTKDKAVFSATSLDKALRLLTKAVDRLLLQQDYEIDVDILRLEIPVASTGLDPLAWLSAQEQQQQRRQQQQQPALFYLATNPQEGHVAETTTSSHHKNSTTTASSSVSSTHQSSSGSTITPVVEVACLGAAKIVTNTSRVWEQDIPPGSVWYGGERFDCTRTPVTTATSSSTTTAHSNDHSQDMTKAWSHFGNAAYWMLPTVELRQTNHTTTTLAVHIVRNDNNNSNDCNSNAMHRGCLQTTRDLLASLTDACHARIPTLLPPVLERSSHGGLEDYEQAVTAALDQWKDPDSTLEKVVVARLQHLQLGTTLSAVQVLRRWKYGGAHEGGHLFLLRPAMSNNNYNKAETRAPEFFGCTPERLFRMDPQGQVRTEALAGSRPRGSTQEADESLLQDLFASPKDQMENQLTARYIERVFGDLASEGLLETPPPSETYGSEYFVRRLRHLQHICRLYAAKVPTNSTVDTRTTGRLTTVMEQLLTRLHPTPAVCGAPYQEAHAFLKKHETFDRGFYSGPIGYIGKDSADIFVAIRSGLITTKEAASTVSMYTGAGLVPGSSFQDEWAETNYKFEVVSSLFPPSPFSLQSAPTPNVAWAASFVEELLRSGVTHFYVCPGSRSTPLVVAIARAARAHVGVAHAVSVHDERAAGFRAVGYAKATGRPAVVVTSSGTAVANLGPAVVEAGLDGVPMILLTADRPYESRDTGANQAIDQVKIFSETYMRWFRDVLPPSDDVPVSVALSDANQAVALSRNLRGPVHVNIQFRENLAPDAGPIRNDGRSESLTRYSGSRFSDAAGFERWSTTGRQWTQSYSLQSSSPSIESIADVAHLIEQSRRGIIVVGNLRLTTSRGESDATTKVAQLISDFAQEIGFPILAGAQTGPLRFLSPAVVPFAEHLLKCPDVSNNLSPDLVIQIGAPLISTEIPSVIKNTLKRDRSLHHVLIHPHSGRERADPDFTVSHSITTDIAPFLKSVSRELNSRGSIERCHSRLAPLVLLGRRIQSQMKRIIRDASDNLSTSVGTEPVLTEPEVALALSESVLKDGNDMALFLSNSMPVRDAEFFFYPFTSNLSRQGSFSPKTTGTNRGASGIDGIISSALGFTEAAEAPTTLLIGDLSALHDLNSMHALSEAFHGSGQVQGKRRNPLTTVVVNNDGGGIFSFLPISKHGQDAAFEDFFGTPTNTFSFAKASEAFGLPYKNASSYLEFASVYSSSLESGGDSLVEVTVVGRDANVAIHRHITESVQTIVSQLLSRNRPAVVLEKLPTTTYCRSTSSDESKTMVLLHGWMGDKSEWDTVGKALADSLSSTWTILSIDLPGHGASVARSSSELSSVKDMLSLNSDTREEELSVSSLAQTVLNSLTENSDINRIDAIAGYSLGGRVALEMKHLCQLSSKNENVADLIGTDTALILLGGSPGDLREDKKEDEMESRRCEKDDQIAFRIRCLSNKQLLASPATEDTNTIWGKFLDDWYGSPLWGDLRRNCEAYVPMLRRRASSLTRNGKELAEALSQCSPPRNARDNWKFCLPEHTLFIAGDLDQKYRDTGREWAAKAGINFIEVGNTGHAILIESPSAVVGAMKDFLEHRNVRPRSDIVTDRDRGTSPTILENESKIFETECPIDGSEALLVSQSCQDCTDIESLEFESFSINLNGDNHNHQSIGGVGWGNNADGAKKLSTRSGLILQLESSDGKYVGLGEVSPLPGLHTESLQDARVQLDLLKDWLQSDFSEGLTSFDSKMLLALEGGLTKAVDVLASESGIGSFHPSVRSGLEMALLSLASQYASAPIHQAVQRTSKGGLLPLNGLVTRGGTPIYRRGKASSLPVFPSLKVKVGYQTLEEDHSSILQGIHVMELSGKQIKIRADANRAWSPEQAIAFATSLDGLDINALNRIEYVEEPLQKVVCNDGSWSIDDQVDSLERWYMQSAIPYGLDESIADLVQGHSADIDLIKNDLARVFQSGSRGCACLVLKPALLGIELSIRIARFVRNDLGVGAVFSSSFDSGLGLAHTAFLGYLSDSSASRAPTYPHGVGTYMMLDGDTLNPPFASYVNEEGQLNVPSLSRALYGLSLDELRDSLNAYNLPRAEYTLTESQVDSYMASTATAGSGKEINVVATLPLPFSAEIASSKFTDLPQQSRWSPWISSVAFKGAESEWTMDIRGIPLTWRATSQILEDPWLGIEWQSVSGVKNNGVVEFVPVSSSTCQMNVRMSIVPPRLLRPLFKGTSVFLEEFLKEKLLKWSLEMFRDVVKADLAVERGDVELGDALFDAVDGKASAIEATLVQLPAPNSDGA